MKPRRAAAVGAVLVALALSLTGVALSAGHAFAQDDEEEDVPLDTKIFRQLMKDWGLRRDEDTGIEYRERAPLVLPPGRDLPPPEDEEKVAKSPAWPKDPDAARRQKRAAAEKAKLKSQTDIFEEEKNPLRPSELNKPGAAASNGTATTSEDFLNPKKPSELGAKSLFSTLFSGNKEDIAPFTGEPARTRMTAPPPGYMTPSPNQPYGLGKDKWVNKPQTIEERSEVPH